MNSLPPTRFVEVFVAEVVRAPSGFHIWSMWYGAWVAVPTHTSPGLECGSQSLLTYPVCRGGNTNNIAQEYIERKKYIIMRDNERESVYLRGRERLVYVQHNFESVEYIFRFSF